MNFGVSFTTGFRRRNIQDAKMASPPKHLTADPVTIGLMVTLDDGLWIRKSKKSHVKLKWPYAKLKHQTRKYLVNQHFFE